MTALEALVGWLVVGVPIAFAIRIRWERFAWLAGFACLLAYVAVAQ